MEELELVCFQIISAAGVAKSNYIQAIQEAKKGNFQKAKACVKEGDTSFMQGHNAHNELIQKEASGNPVSPNLLLIHAEDQLMSVENFKILAVELIENYEQLIALKNK